MRRILFVVAFVFVPIASWPQGNPVGPEFRVNTYTTVSQRAASVAADASGNFVVVWNGNDQDGSLRGVFGQRYAASGVPVGPEFRVNTYTTLNQDRPAVAADPSGNFVVMWHGNGSGDVNGVFGQRFDSSGAPLGGEFRVNTFTTGLQTYPSIAADASGNFVVAWRTFAAGGASYDISGQRFASTGAPLGVEFRVNTTTPNAQAGPSVATDTAGNFVVVWQSDNQDGSFSGIFGQRYTSAGVPLGPEFRVNTYTTNAQYLPSVAADPAGNFIVAWTSYTQDGHGEGVFGQRYASAGAPIGPEFRVNTFTTQFQIRPSVAADASGNFVVIWDSTTQDGSIDGIFGQRYAASGTPLGPEFRVNTFTNSYQGDPSVAADPLGRFIVVWTSYLQDGGDLGVYGQRYEVIVPVELMRFRVE
jgi:hypothetical protein